MHNDFTPTVLSIAGSDPYGGAGIQVDSKVIHALGGYALSVTTALTAQNSQGVKDVLSTPTEHFKSQLYTLLDDIKVNAVKIGMLANRDIIAIVAEAITKYKLKNIVLDTVLLSSSGKALLDPLAVDFMVQTLFPLADVITPNIPEMNSILGTNFKGREEELKEIALRFSALGVKAVLMKGGHSEDRENASDYLLEGNSTAYTFTTIRVQTSHTHGTGCVLSSAIATGLAKNKSLVKSVGLAKEFLYQRLLSSHSIKLNYYQTEEISRKEPML